MKIGVITSGNEQVKLFSFLQKYDHDYTLVYDNLFFPYTEKPTELVVERIKEHIAMLKKQGIEKIILPPVYELMLLEEGNDLILPLFSTYVLNQCYTHSLIGKIGFFGDYTDIQEGQSLLAGLARHYKLTDAQKKIKKFHNPFTYRGKEAPLLKHFLVPLSASHYLINSTLKFDLRYFKDAGVDTVIPFNYGYFFFQKTLKKFFNFKKIRLHDLDTVQDVFLSLVKSKPAKKNTLTIYSTGMKELLEREKKMMSILIPGGNVNWKELK